MIKWFAYIVLMLIIAPALLSAKGNGYPHALFHDHPLFVQAIRLPLTDTAAAAKNSKHTQDQEDKKKIKEIGKARRQPKPEKVTDDAVDAKKNKTKRVRRPEGMERPPEIPRRSGD